MQITIFVCLSQFFIQASWAQMIVSHRSPEVPQDVRENYNTALLKLALEKTIPKYGPYEIREFPPMNHQRTWFSMRSESYPNMLVEESYQDDYMESGDLTFIDFPIDLGITGTRICFINPAIKELVAQNPSIERLKKYNMGQGIGWSDSNILKANGFHVTEIASYDSIFKMTIAGRLDLFCRGINELPEEYKAFKFLQGLTYDESFALIYNMPRFFFTSSKNTLLKARMEEGLRMAWRDGSILQLWLKHNKNSVDFANIKQRKMYYLPNPYLKHLNTHYQDFYLDFTKL